MQKIFVLIFYCTFHEILLLLIVKGGVINFDALHQLLYLFPFDITISLSWFPLLCLHYIPLYHRGRETSSRVGGGVGWGWGCILDSPFLSVRLSDCPLTFRLRPVVSTILDGFFPYLVQKINSMRGCVAWDYPWPWPISSRSFGLDLDNRVRSEASAVLDGFFLYLAQMITGGGVACYVFFRICKFEVLANCWNFSALTLKKNQYERVCCI